MAAPANDLRRVLTTALQLLRPFPGRAEFAARLALICALTALVVEIYQTPEPALTTYVAFFVMKPDRVTCAALSAVMTLLITIVVGSVILVSMVVVDQPLWRVTNMAVISLGLLFLASASKLKPIAGIVALIAAYALDLLGRVQIGELATRGLLYAWLFVAIPAAVSLVVNLLVGPPPRRLVERALGHRLALAAAMLRNPDHLVRYDFNDVLFEGTGEIQTWLKLAGAEKTSPPEDIATLRQATASITPILLLVDSIGRSPEMQLSSEIKERLAQTFDRMASILSQGGYPIEITLDEEADLAPSAVPVFAEIGEELACFSEAPLPDLPSPKAEEAKGGFFLPDAFTNPEHIHYALKTTAAAMFCYFVYSLLDWPGIHTCLITCYIVSLGTTAETLEKLTLRILGCLIGAAAGIAAIVFLTPNLTSIGGLIIVVFLAAFASGWVAAGSPRISYAGFQMAFAFFLSVIQGSAPAFDMTIARDRVIGILFGNLVVYLIFTNIWPVTVTARIDGAIASLFRRLGTMATAMTRSGRCALATEASATLGAIEQDLGLANYEPPSVRATKNWIELRYRTVEELGPLIELLLLPTNRDSAFRHEISQRLMRLADSFGTNNVQQIAEKRFAADDSHLPPSSATASDSVDRQIVVRVESLERALAEGVEAGAASYAPA